MFDTDPKIIAEKTAWLDDHDLRFWVWACLHDAESYLASSKAFNDWCIERSRRADFETSKLEEIRNRMRLEQYHFVTAVGNLVRTLNRTAPRFPPIQQALPQMPHLLKEGKDLRDMIEYADEYLVGKGRYQDRFVRAAESVAANLPGSMPAIADATSTIVDDNGHWLGGRLNVEKVVAEVQILSDVLVKTPSTMPPSIR